MSANLHAAMTAECMKDCRKPSWLEVRDDAGDLVGLRLGSYEMGDVRRCAHGRIWRCRGHMAHGGYSPSGYWELLSPVFTPVLFRRARRLLGDSSEVQGGGPLL